MPELITICSGRQFTPLERAVPSDAGAQLRVSLGVARPQRSSSFSSMTSFVSFRHVENGKWSRSTLIGEINGVSRLRFYIPPLRLMRAPDAEDAVQLSCVIAALRLCDEVALVHKLVVGRLHRVTAAAKMRRQLALGRQSLVTGDMPLTISAFRNSRCWNMGTPVSLLSLNVISFIARPNLAPSSRMELTLWMWSVWLYDIWGRRQSQEAKGMMT